MPTKQSPARGVTSGHPYKTQDVADRYGITVWGVRRLVRAKKLKAINIGGAGASAHLRFSEADLQKFERDSAA